MLRATIRLDEAVLKAALGRGFDGGEAQVALLAPNQEIRVPATTPKPPRVTEVRWLGTKPTWLPDTGTTDSPQIVVTLPDRCVVWVVDRSDASRERGQQKVYVVLPNGGWDHAVKAAESELHRIQIDTAERLVGEVRGWTDVGDAAKKSALNFLRGASDDDVLATRSLEMGLTTGYRCLRALKEVLDRKAAS